MKHLLLSAASISLLAGPALAQAPFAVTGQNPARTSLTVPYTTAVSLQFSQLLSNSATNRGAARVFGSQRGGKLAGIATVSGNRLNFQPYRSLVPGEKLSVSVTNAVTDTTGQTLRDAFVSEFTVAAVGGTGVFGGGSDPRAGSSSRRLVTGDVDGDGDLDMVTADSPSGGTGAVSVRLNNGVGVYSAGATITSANSATNLQLADVDGDGDLDLLFTMASADALVVRMNNGSGQFSGGSSFNVGSFPSGIAPADVDGDGDLDLLVVCSNGAGSVSVCINNGSGAFTRRSSVQAGATNSGPNDVTAADVDGDGDIDFITSNSFNSTFSVCANNGFGQFFPYFTSAAGTSTLRPRRVLTGDINGDGQLDLLVVNTAFGAGSISVRYGDTQGQFPTGYELTNIPLVYDAALADVDGDHDLDLVTCNNNSSGMVNVLLNNGQGAFSAGNSVAVGSSALSIVATDVDGDGDLDVVTANGASNSTLSVRLNGGTGIALANRSAQQRTAMTVYPNPAHDLVRVTVPAGATTLQLLDPLGRVVREQRMGAGAATEASLSVTGLTPGWYLLRAGAATQALVVE